MESKEQLFSKGQIRNNICFDFIFIKKKKKFNFKKKINKIFSFEKSQKFHH